jgi:hypothetical protein
MEAAAPDTIHPASWLGLAQSGRGTTWKGTSAPLIDAQGRTIPRMLPSTKGEAILLYLCPGNGAAKLTVLRAPGASADDADDPDAPAMGRRKADAPRLLFQRIESAWNPAPTTRAGQHQTSYRLDDGSPFRIGNPFAKDARTLPVGMTETRMGDPRYREFLLAAILETLVAAGYTPLSDPESPFPIYLGYGVPIEEISLHGVSETTKAAMKWLRKSVHQISRTDSKGQTSTWPIWVENVSYAPQTQGAFYAWRHNLAGEPVITGLTRATTLDFGFGHLQAYHAEFADGRLSASGDILGDGMIEIARQLITLVKRDYQHRLDENMAQYALMTGEIEIGGFRQAITPQITQAVQIGGATLMQRADPIYEDIGMMLLCSGGGIGNARLAALIHERIQSKGRRPHSSLLLPGIIAGFANPIGGYAYSLYTVLKSLRARR